MASLQAIEGGLFHFSIFFQIKHIEAFKINVLKINSIIKIDIYKKIKSNYFYKILFNNHLHITYICNMIGESNVL